MKNKLFFLILFLITLISGCITIAINENDYRVLNEEKLKRIKQFDDVRINQVMNYDSTLYLYEITATDIKESVKNQKYTWVHLWRPYCKADFCQNISYYEVIEEKFESNDLELLIVSQTYDFKEIDTIVRNSNYQKPIFVLQDAFYGHKTKPSKLKFHYELYPDDKTERKIGEDDFLFKGSELIYVGRHLDENMIDSLIQINQ